MKTLRDILTTLREIRDELREVNRRLPDARPETVVLREMDRKAKRERLVASLKPERPDGFTYTPEPKRLGVRRVFPADPHCRDDLNAYGDAE